MSSPVQPAELAAVDATTLVAHLSQFRGVTVAFSGGVDSSVVAAAAYRALGSRAVAITADSPSVARSQLEIAHRVAKEIGIEHRIVSTNELGREEYRRNDGQRCFFCKQTLYAAVSGVIEQLRGESTEKDIAILSGTNADDLGDYRPGIRAGLLAGVLTPLADLGFTKSRVRAIATMWGLSVKDLPASPCLSSRLAYGVEVTAERLQRIEVAETWLGQQGFADIRVRLHADDLARLEIDREQWTRLIDNDVVSELNQRFRQLGFKFVTLDLQGRRSGSLNDVLVSLSTSQPRRPTVHADLHHSN